MRSSVAVAACFAPVVLAAGCEGEREQARRAEAGRIAHAISALRDAPNEAKAPRILALEREVCSAKDSCELKDACLEGYRLHVRALEASRVAGRALEADAGSNAGHVAELIASSARDLDRARELTRRCSELQAALQRRYGF